MYCKSAKCREKLRAIWLAIGHYMCTHMNLVGNSYCRDVYLKYMFFGFYNSPKTPTRKKFRQRIRNPVSPTPNIIILKISVFSTGLPPEGSNPPNRRHSMSYAHKTSQPFIPPPPRSVSVICKELLESHGSVCRVNRKRTIFLMVIPTESRDRQIFMEKVKSWKNAEHTFSQKGK